MIFQRDEMMKTLFLIGTQLPSLIGKQRFNFSNFLHLILTKLTIIPNLIVRSINKQ